MADTVKRRPTQYETRRAIRKLEEAIESLSQYCDPEDEHCSIPAEHREAGRLYLGSWVEGPLGDALAMLKRSQEGERPITSHWQE
jgi:hypothetical protein